MKQLTDIHNEQGLRADHVRSGKSLELLTIGWNSLEAVIAVVSGLLAGSIALVGFGLDSVIEVSSGFALLWRLALDADAARREKLDATALKIVGVSFLALAAYVAFERNTGFVEKRAA